MKTSLMDTTAELQQASSQPEQVITPAPRDAWREVMRSDPKTLVSQSPEWLESLQETGPFMDASRYYELQDGQRMVLPLARRRLLGGLSTAASYQNSWGIGGVISSKPLRREHLQAVVQDLLHQRDIHTIIRPDPLVAEIWEEAVPDGVVSFPKLAHVLDLEGGYPYVWEKKFKGTARTAIRKAEKSNLVVERDTSGRLIPVFYDLFKRSLERWGRQQHEPIFLTRLRGSMRDPLSKFEALARNLGEALHIWVAWSNGEPAAAIVVLQGKNANYTRGAMNKTLAGPTRANDLLHRLAIEEACEAGCRYYHMGESGSSTSLASFKQNFGAQPIPYAEYHFERLPITRVDQSMRGIVKRVIGFKDES